jgi:predicted RNA-binding protein with PIN domain
MDLLIDGMNVIGSRPNGWWRDREAAARRLRAQLEAYAAARSIDATLVLDGSSPADFVAGVQGDVRVLYARDGGFATADDLIVALLREHPNPAAVEVITSDRALRQRVRSAGANIGSPGGLLELLGERPQ